MYTDDLIGSKFGKLNIVSKNEDVSKQRKEVDYNCRCDCGNEIVYPRFKIMKKINDGTYDSLSCGECFKREMVGQIFGDFKILQYEDEESIIQNRAIFKCRCMNCGDVVNKMKSKLEKGQTILCRKCRGSAKREDINDYLGKTFGDLKVLSYNEKLSKESGRSMFDCECLLCGSVKAYLSSNLKGGIATSCGCSRSGYDSKHTIPMIGETFGELTVVELDQAAIDAHKEASPSNKGYVYICECPKGHRSSHRGTDLRSGKEYCPMCHIHGKNANFEDLTGRTFGRLKVIKEAGKAIDGGVLWECACTAPGEVAPHAYILRSSHVLKSGNTTSCGCAITDAREKQRIYDPNINSALKIKYSCMIDRCNNPSNGYYDRYGGRGITTEYTSYNDFYFDNCDKYMKALEMYPGQTIEMDRIDNDGNYEKNNIRFVPQKTNNINREITRFYVFRNQLWTTGMMSEYAIRNGNNIAPGEIIRRLNAGWEIENAILNPTSDENARYIKKPIYDMEEVKLMHKLTQGLHPDDIDYFYNDIFDDVLACDYKDLIKHNLEINNGGAGNGEN